MPYAALLLRNIRDEDDENKSLEQRVDQLTTTVENMQKMMDRFVALHESERLQINPSQRVVVSEASDKAAVTKMKMQMSRQAEIHALRKQLWERERQSLERELQKKCLAMHLWERERQLLERQLQRFKCLSREKCSTHDSSTQTTAASELATSDVPAAKCTAYKYHHDCKKSNLRAAKTPKYHCSLREFFRRAKYKRANRTARKGNSPVESRTVDNDRLTEIARRVGELRCDSVTTNESNNQQDAEQTAKTSPDTVRLPEGERRSSGQPSASISEFPATSAGEKILIAEALSSSESPARNSSFDDEAEPLSFSEFLAMSAARKSKEKQARRRLRVRFTSLLEEHDDCADSECMVMTFKGYLKHANECTLGGECHWYICKCKHSRSEHAKVCYDKTQCSDCLPYVFFNEESLQGMMRVLERGCGSSKKREPKYPMNGDTREVFVTMVSRLSVDYGLLDDDDEKNVEKQTKLLPGVKNESSSLLSDADDWEVIESAASIS